MVLRSIWVRYVLCGTECLLALAICRTVCAKHSCGRVIIVATATSIRCLTRMTAVHFTVDVDLDVARLSSGVAAAWPVPHLI